MRGTRMQKKILVAMSGGVDSSVCAYLLQQMNYDCRGVMMTLFSKQDPCFQCKNTSTEADAEDAGLVAKRLGIPFSLIDLSDTFRANVIDYFTDTYLAGGTPNPCVQCNKTMKFGALLNYAKTVGCEYLATGHYARVKKSQDGRFLLLRAKDLSKDQSYVLWQLSQEQLSHILFPLGEMSKAEVRDIAHAVALSTASRSDSQDICFIPDGDYVSFIERYRAPKILCGKFIDKEGNILGEHKGALRYTVGQRKGLGIAFGKPTYVCSKNVAENTVTLGSNDDLFSKKLSAHSINLIATERLSSPMRIEAKIRYSASPAAATVEQTSESTFSLTFDEAQRAITPGQSVVLYDGDCVIGGGIIES